MMTDAHFSGGRPLPRRVAGRGRRGFALLEMMITISILSIGVLALGSVAVKMSQQMREGGGMIRASAAARTRFEKLSAQQCNLIAAGTTTATTGIITEQWTITPQSRSVAVTNVVSFPVGRTRKSATFQTLIPCPARP